MAISKRNLFGSLSRRNRQILFDVVLMPRRKKVPSVHTEWKQPVDVKAYLTNVLDIWMRDLRLSSQAESDIGKARAELDELSTEEFFRDIGVIWHLRSDVCPAQIVVVRWPELF